MAERRMFAKTILDSDVFLELPATAQMLYIHLGMQADDDGFVVSPKRILRAVGSSEEDLRQLVDHGLVIQFASGVVVITHWRVHNYVPPDRYKETFCTEEKAMLTVLPNRSYALLDTVCIQDVSSPDTNGFQIVSNPDTQIRLGKVRIVKDSADRGKEKDRGMQGGKKKPTSADVQDIIQEIASRKAANEAEKRRNA